MYPEISPCLWGSMSVFIGVQFTSHNRHINTSPWVWGNFRGDTGASGTSYPSLALGEGTCGWSAQSFLFLAEHSPLSSSSLLLCQRARVWIFSFFHLNPIIITLVIDNIPPFQRALKSVSTMDDIIVVPERCIQTITHSNRSGKGCPSIPDAIVIWLGAASQPISSPGLMSSLRPPQSFSRTIKEKKQVLPLELLSLKGSLNIWAA